MSMLFNIYISNRLDRRRVTYGRINLVTSEVYRCEVTRVSLCLTSTLLQQ